MPGAVTRCAARLLVGLAGHLAAGGAAAADEGAAPEAWSLHLQSTGVYQAHPGFRAAVDGPNSLNSGTEIRETVTATLFVGARLWRGAQLYVDPEAAQGFGFSDTLGVAGFPNGEATKAGANTPKAYMARAFLRQSIGLGG